VIFAGGINDNEIVNLLILIAGLLVSFSFFYLIEKRRRIRNNRRKESYRGKFEHLRRIVRED
jgi:hypothetical protein